MDLSMNRPLRLLVVSDSETDSALCRDVLREAGFQVNLSWAKSVNSAKREIPQDHWDCVVVSTNLENLVWKEFLPVIRAIDPDTFVIALSDRFDEDIFAELLHTGVTNVVSRLRRERLKRVFTNLQSDLARADRSLPQEPEELLWPLYNSSPDPLALFRVEGEGQYTLVLANRALVKVANSWGLSPSVDQLIGRNTREVALNDWKLPWDLYWKLHSQMGNACAFHKPLTEDQQWILPAGVHSTSITFYPILNEGDVCKFVLARMRVLGEEQDAPGEGEDSNRVQAQKMEALGALAGGIAHDFNNILTCMLGYAEMAIRKIEVGHPMHEDLSQILTAGVQARELVNQILTFSRKQPVQKRNVDLTALVDSSLRLLRSGAPSNISIETALPKDGLELFVDPNQLLQVLLNLCTNAFHAMPNDGGKVTISANLIPPNSRHPLAREMQPGQAYVELTVADTGIGMSRETMRRIFEPLFTTKRATQGTGLGLSIVHGIVRSHGGFIHVESKLGQGSQFQVYLPKGTAMVEGAVAASVEPDRSLPAVQPAAAKGRHVLIVDDDRDVGRLAARILETFQYETTALTDPNEAINLVRKHPAKFDLILTDLLMPELSGPELARAVKRIRPDLPLVLISGLVSAVTEESARRQGFVALIRKPFEIAQIEKSVAGVLKDAPAVQAA
jgi:signal transduction histidine kinase/DNA-binding response OmpR family regulator